MVNTSGFSETQAGNGPSAGDASADRLEHVGAFSREHDGHPEARRFPHRTWVTPSGSWRLEYLTRISPAGSTVSAPCSRIGREQFPTRASASDHQVAVLRACNG